MSAPSLQSRVNTRSVKKLEKPRPLKLNVTQNRSDNRLSAGISLEEVMALADSVCQLITNGGSDRTLQANVLNLSASLKLYGQQLETVYKDQLDRLFVTLRNGSRDERIDYVSRLHLLELVELRGAQWAGCETMSDYYRHKAAHTYQHSLSSEESVPVMESPVTPTGALNSLGPLGVHGPLGVLGLTPSSAPSTPQPSVLAPGEVLKTSGKFPKPTKIPNKNYCKDEVVIRNSDSGKVMGIKGRRVHLIEEMSETIISFQRVSPGAKERLVQITGPSEEKIIHARHLMEDTIRRNASPVRPELSDRDIQREALGGSSSSLNSSASDDSNRMPHAGARHSTLLHSFSTNDAHLGEYKYTVAVGGCVLKITGSNHDLVRAAKLFLDEYFANQDLSYINSYEEDLPSPPGSAPANISASPVNITMPVTTTTAVGSADSSTSESDETIKTAVILAQNADPGVTTANKILVEEGSELDSAVRSSVRRSLISEGGSSNAKIEEDEVTLSPGMVTIVRQPLFPHASKEAFVEAEKSTRFVDTMATVRRSLFARTAAANHCDKVMKNIVAQDAASGCSPSYRYSLETLLKLSESSLSRGEPQDWSRISRDYPTIVKKTVEPFDPNVYRRAADREYPVVTAEETGSPDPE